jgi:cytosine deaminase
LVAGFVDIHSHLEKAFTFDATTSITSFRDLAISFADRLISFTHADIVTRATKVVDMAIAHGTTAMRIHLVVF